MLVNEHISWRRKWSRLIPHEVMPVEHWESDHAERLADRDWLHGCSTSCRRSSEQWLVLRYYEGLDDKAIAEILGCSFGTVRSHIKPRARRAADQPMDRALGGRLR